MLPYSARTEEEMFSDVKYTGEKFITKIDHYLYSELVNKLGAP